MKSIAMLQQINKRKIEELEHRLDQSYKIINELIGALTCQSEELRMLTRDVALSYMESVNENRITEQDKPREIALRDVTARLAKNKSS